MSTRLTSMLQTQTIEKCFAFTEDAVKLAIGSDVKARIDERNDKSYATQVYYSMAIGATRMEEDKVVEIRCNE
jgi:hypothetical protein